MGAHIFSLQFTRLNGKNGHGGRSAVDPEWRHSNCRLLLYLVERCLGYPVSSGAFGSEGRAITACVLI
jgi:hypothetical protein